MLHAPLALQPISDSMILQLGTRAAPSQLAIPSSTDAEPCPGLQDKPPCIPHTPHKRQPR